MGHRTAWVSGARLQHGLDYGSSGYWAEFFTIATCMWTEYARPWWGFDSDHSPSDMSIQWLWDKASTGLTSRTKPTGAKMVDIEKDMPSTTDQ